MYAIWSGQSIFIMYGNVAYEDQRASAHVDAAAPPLIVADGRRALVRGLVIRRWEAIPGCRRAGVPVRKMI
jgi:hypothetical protein